MAEAKIQAEKERSDKEKALEVALVYIEKQFGKGSIMKLGEHVKMDIPVISTGSLTLDLALGVGGVPRGRVVEIFGPEGGGKTTLTLNITAECQRAGGVAAFIDAEHAMDPRYARTLGVRLNDLLVSQPDTGEQALDIVEALVRSNAVDLVVIDSVAALVPQAEIEGAMGEPHMGLQARMMSQAMRKLTGVISKTKTCVIFINQIREKIGVMFGSPETTPGGRALKFYSSVRIDLRRIENIKVQDKVMGSRVRAKIVKNKVAPPFREAEFEILYNEGISKAGSIIDTAERYEVLQRAGAWYSLDSQRLAQGRDMLKAYLKENPKVLLDLEKRVREKFAAMQK